MSDNNVSKLVYSDRPGMVKTIGLSREIAKWLNSDMAKW